MAEDAANKKRERRAARRSEEESRNRYLPKRPNPDGLNVYDRHNKPATLKDIYWGCSMFLVCGGPSIDNHDYSQLSGRGIVSLGVNNIAGKVPTDFFVCSDPPEKFSHEIWMDPKVTKLIPKAKAKKRIRFKYGEEFVQTPFRTKDVPNIFFFDRREWFDPADFLTSEAATWGNNKAAVEKGFKPNLLFTFFLGLRLCHYLGAVNVYMLGVDFDMNEGDESKPAYGFDQSKHAGGRRSNKGSYSKATKWCEQLKPVFDKAGFNVFNTNPNSKLEVFPFVSFDQALANCRGSFVTGDADLREWYRKVDPKTGDLVDG